MLPTDTADEGKVIISVAKSEEANELVHEIQKSGFTVEYRSSESTTPMARIGNKIFKGYREIELAFSLQGG